MSVFVECRVCKVPMTVPELVSTCAFPDDVDVIIDLLTGRLNVVPCPVCGSDNALMGPLVVFNAGEVMVVLVVDPEDAADVIRACAAELEDGVRVVAVSDYGELDGLVRQWVWRHSAPIFAVVQSPDAPPPDADFVELMTPLFLAGLQLSAEGVLPIGMTGDPSPETRSRITQELFEAIMLDHLSRILRELGRRGTLADAYDEIVRRVPARCFTSEVLSATAQGCPPPVNPFEEGPRWVAGFRAHLRNSLAHACAGVANPHALTWAAYVVIAWQLNQREDTTLDSQILLGAGTLRATLPFEALWNTVLPHAVNNGEADTTEERLKDAFDLLAHCGYEIEATEAFRFPLHADLSSLAGDHGPLVDIYEAQLVEQWHGLSEPTESPLPTLVVQQLLQMGAADAARELTDRMLTRARDVADAAAVLMITSQAIEAFNRFERYRDAARLLEQALPHAAGAVELPPSIGTTFWTEAGNVLRYQRKHASALNAYDMAATFSELVGGSQHGARDFVLQRNRAIVLRQSGDYAAALDVLEALRASHPADAGVLDSLAVLYAEINRPDQALDALGAALALPEGALDRVARNRMLRNRGWVHHLAGSDDDAAADLALAWRDLPADSTSFRGRLAAGVLHLRPTTEAGRDFVETCRHHIAGALDDDAGVGLALQGQMLTAAVMRLLEDGHIAAATTLMERHAAIVEELGSNAPWQLDHAVGWLLFACGDIDECWPFIAAALDAVDARVPSGSNAAFALAWMQDKTLLQRNAATIALQLVDAGVLPAEELVTIFEFLNGREIAAQFDRGDDTEPRSADEIVAAVDERLVADVFFFIDSPESVRMAHLTPAEHGGRRVHLEAFKVPRDELLSCRDGLRAALAAANPADLTPLDRKLSGWHALSHTLWSALEGCSGAGRHVVFLPGRAMSGMPLHTVGAPGGPGLIARTSVSFAPNFATLAHAAVDRPAGAAPRAAVVVVPKRTDSTGFRRRADDAADGLALRLGPDTVVLRAECADRAASVGAMGEADEIVFLCHGTDAGGTRGHSICVAADGELPPSFLPVEDAPVLEGFVLSWSDLAHVRPSPRIVVSTACSTAWTTVLEGGARIGLEQGLFASGTSHIISPLWDVDQRAALDWIDSFHRLHGECPQLALHELFREATLDVRTRSAHMYFWAPFILNGQISIGA